jgi:outer membrane protein assembly factor BamB
MRDVQLHLAVALALGLLPAVAVAQDPSPEPAVPTDKGNADDVVPSTEAQPASPTPASAATDVRLQLIAEIGLPGPLSADGPAWADGTIRLETAGQVATLSTWTGEAEVTLSSTPTDGESGEAEVERLWSFSEDGVFRSAALPTGFIVAEKRCPRCRDGWNRLWKLRVAGSRIAPPLVTEKRILFAAQDDVVYAVSKRNGYRLWSTILDERSTRRLVRWRGTPSNTATPAVDPPDDSEEEPEEPLDVVIVLADAGDQVFILNAETGSRVTELTLEESQGSLKGVPLVTPEGYIALARQAYNENEAALMVFELRSGSAVSLSPRVDEEPDESSDGNTLDPATRSSTTPTPGSERKKGED